MTGRDSGFLLLTSHLGDPERKSLTVAQFRDLARRMRWMEKPDEDRELTQQDVMMLGCDRAFAARVIDLLSQTEELNWYLRRAEKCDCQPITRLSDLYPQKIRNCLGLEAPGCLWAKGNLALLDRPMIALVGSRVLQEENCAFAREVGKQAALQGYTLVSGNARGADQEAQNSCLEYGGCVVSVIADELENKPLTQRVLYLSEDGFDIAFSAQRAISRNRIVHSLPQKTFVAQTGVEKGGTWDGTVKNLRNLWSPVFCFDDKTKGAYLLMERGATPVTADHLHNIAQLQCNLQMVF